MGDASSSVHYTVPNDVLVQVLSDGELVLLNLVSEAYYGLDGVGSDLFGLLRDGTSVAEAHERLLETYDIDSDTLNADVNDLINNLVEHGLLAKSAE